MKPKYIVYCLAAIVLCFVFMGFEVHKEMYDIFDEGYKTNQPICEIRPAIEEKMGVLEGLFCKLSAFVAVLVVCASFSRGCR